MTNRVDISAKVVRKSLQIRPTYSDTSDLNILELEVTLAVNVVRPLQPQVD